MGKRFLFIKSTIIGLGTVCLLNMLTCNAEAITPTENLATLNRQLVENGKLIFKDNPNLSSKDNTRPIYHLMSYSGWMNDPTATFTFNGDYSVGFESNPSSAMWDNMTLSKVQTNSFALGKWLWTYPHKGDSLNPYDSKLQLLSAYFTPTLSDTSPDKNGIFDGSVRMLQWGVVGDLKNPLQVYPTMLYSAVWGNTQNTGESICLARNFDAGVSKEKGLVDPWYTNWIKYIDGQELVYPYKEKNNHLIPVPTEDVNAMDPVIVVNQPTPATDKGMSPLASFRDPFLFNITSQPDYEYMIVSAGFTNSNSKPMGAIVLYAHKAISAYKEGELVNWAKGWFRVNKGNDFFFKASVAVKTPLAKSGDFECGNIFQLTNANGSVKDSPMILIYGVDAGGTNYGKSEFYVFGNIVGTPNSKNGIHFVPLTSPDYKTLSGYASSDGKDINPGHLDLNPNFYFYAGTTFPQNNEKRNLFIGWLLNQSQSKDKSYPWNGTLSIPRFLFAQKINSNGKEIFELGQMPQFVDARGTLIGNTLNVNFTGVKKNVELFGTGRHLRIDATFSTKDGKNISKSDFGLTVGVSAKTGKSQDIKILNDHLYVGKIEVPEALGLNGSKCNLNVYLDGSIIEIFISKYINNEQFSFKVFSGTFLNNDSSDVELNSDKLNAFGDSEVSATINVYDMSSCWVNKLPLG